MAVDKDFDRTTQCNGRADNHVVIPNTLTPEVIEVGAAVPVIGAETT
ncbi:hypothetical protein ACL02S_02020 [Nocardia sp. 004]